MAPPLLGQVAAQTGAQPQSNLPSASKGSNSPGLVSNYAKYADRRIAAIEIRGALGDERVQDYLRDLVVQKNNEPFDRRKIRESLQALYASGRFSDVEAVVEPLAGGDLILAFVTRPNYFVGYKTTEGGPKRPTSGQLLDSAKIQLGELFTQSKIDSSIRRMKALMAENGFYQAQLTARTTVRPENQLIDVNYVIDPGPPAHIGTLTIEGDAGFSAEQIAKSTNLETGHTVTADRISKALQKLRKKYSKGDYLEAQVSLIDRKYHPETNTVDFTLKIFRGREVAVRTDGASIGKRKLKKYVPIYEEHAVDADLLNEGSRNLRNYLQTEGYFDAEVAYRQQTADNRLNIIYSIERGDKRTLAAIQFDGNKYFDDPLLRERLQIQTKSFSLKHGRYSQALLSDDVDNLTNLYRANGFDQVKVKTEVLSNYNGKPSDLAIAFHFTEGPQSRVHLLRIEGDNQVPEDQLRALLTMVEGQPYSSANAAADRESVLSYYFNHGYPDVDFQATTSPLPDQPSLLDVTYKISEGQQVFVDRVLLSQLLFTRQNVVEKQLQIRDGDPLSQIEMLKSQERLYNLGVFNEVQIAVQNPDGDSRFKDVLLQFQEAKRWTFNYGFGIEASSGQPGTSSVSSGEANPTTISQGKSGVSPRVSFDVTRINFRGRAHTISLKSSYGSLQKRALISYDAPRWLGDPKLRLTFTALYDNTIDVTTFTSERLEGSAQLEQRVNRSTTLLYRFIYRRVKATNVVVSPDLIPILSLPVRVGMPTFTYIRDKRDSPVDSHKGNYTTFDVGVAATAFGSEADFGRFLITNSTYHPFHKKWVFARSLQVGIAEPWADTIVPLPERFFAGGANTHRGFSLNQAGPRDLGTGSPLGGNALLLNNLELRFPPMSLPWIGEGLSFVAFHDVGNVFEDSKEMVRSVFRWYQPRQDLCRDPNLSAQCSFSYMSQAVGGGLRYQTPIGPVRVDVGYNLNPTVYPQFTTNSAGQQVFTPQTTRRVNFYFSIGQTF
ncbi:MAG TPA: POTRA domain-containing protein [Terriglobales bacterium]|nr:POTRA domain-containing protein [Terriglobales bacterium]